VAAFRSTLEETREADLLIHLVDASDPHRAEKIADVQDVIREVGAEDVPQLTVFNKIDCLNPVVDAHIDYGEDELPQRVWVSAKNGLGTEMMLDAIASFFRGAFITVKLVLDVKAGKRRAELYTLGTILDEGFDDFGNSEFTMCLTEQEWQQVSQWDEVLSFSEQADALQ